VNLHEISGERIKVERVIKNKKAKTKDSKFKEENGRFTSTR
jgi:hypothetical protein